MRPLLVGLIVTLTSIAQAEPIEISMRSTLTIGPIDEPHTLIVSAAHTSTPHDIRTLLTIPEITPADQGMVWSINARNAAGYGFDWAALEEITRSPVSFRLFHSLRSDGGTNPTGMILRDCYPWSCILEFELERVDVTLHRFEIVPGFPRDQLRSEYSTAIFGNGRVVPEPQAIVLVLGLHGICLIGLRRR